MIGNLFEVYHRIIVSTLHIITYTSIILLFKENYGKSITKHGYLCVVPWKYNDKTYESCANPDSDPKGPWCPTKLDDDGQFMGSNHWGHCSVMSKTRQCLKANGI